MSAVPLGGATAHVVFTTRADGDLQVDQTPDALAERRAQVVDLPWTWLRQVHGADVVVVDEPGGHAGVEADAAVTAIGGAVLAIHTADCVPVALLSQTGAVGAVHAGWRGLESGVVEAAVERMRDVGGSRTVEAIVGPCIHPECYEFGAADLDRLAARYGDVVRGTTKDGAPAADMPAAVTEALRGAGVERIEDRSTCTVCDSRYYSHRARGDAGRQALAVWIEP